MRLGDSARIAALRRFGPVGKQTQRQRYLERVRGLIEEHVDGLTDRVPVAELVRVIEPIYRQADLRGYRRGCRARQRARGER